MDGFTTQQVAQLTEVGRGTLAYWDRSGFLSPSLANGRGIGSPRLYTFQDLVAIRVAYQFRRRGISLQALRRVVRFLQDRHTTCPLAERYLVTDGEDVYTAEGDNVVSLLRQPGQECLFFVMDLNQIVVGLTDTVATLQKAADLLSARQRKPP